MNRAAFNIALRYFFFRKKISFISIIAMLSVLGIAVGVAALICVSSIFNGFRTLFHNMLVGFDPHIRIEIPMQYESISASLPIEIAALPNISIAASAVYTQGKIITAKNGSTHPLVLNAVDTNTFFRVSGLHNSVPWGKPDLSNISSLPSVVIGVGAADKLHVLPGDTIYCLALQQLEQAAYSSTPPLGIPVMVSGIMLANIKEYDAYYCYGSSASVAHLISTPMTCIDLRFSEEGSAAENASAIAALHSHKYSVKTWYDLHSDIYGVVEFERMISFIIVGIVVLVSAFNILASLSMTAVKKRKDIAVLRAMGATKAAVQSIFIIQGMLAGFTATIFGVILGVGLCWGQQQFGWILLNSETSIVSAMPVAISWEMVAIAVAATLTLCFLATVYPAKRAASMGIAESVARE